MPRWDILGLSWESFSGGGALRGPLWNTSFLSCHGSRGPWILATPSNQASWRRRGRSEVAAEPQGPRAVAAAWKPGQRLAAPDSDPAKLEECAPGAICSASWFYDQSPEGGKNEFIRAAPASPRRWLCAARPRARPGGLRSPARGTTCMGCRGGGLAWAPACPTSACGVQ